MKSAETEHDQALDKVISLRLPSSWAEELERLAAFHDVTVGQLLRVAVKNLLVDAPNEEGVTRSNESTPESYEEIRAAVSDALRGAKSWTELQEALATRDLEYFVMGGGLALRRRSSGEKVCKASEVGPGYSQLLRILKSAFPGHPHTWIAKRVLET